MNSLKTMALVAVMAAVAYGVFAVANKRPDAPPPAALPASTELGGIKVEMPGPAGGIPLAAPGASNIVTPAAAPLPVSPFPSASPGPAAAPPPTGERSALDKSQALAPSTPSSIALLPPATGTPSSHLPAATSTPARTAIGSHIPTTRPEGGFAVAADDSSHVRSASAGPQDFPDFRAKFREAMTIAYQELSAGRIAKTHVDLSPWYAHPELNADEEKELVDLLDRLAGTVLFSHRHHLLEPAYQVRAGDAPESIAAEYKISWDLLAKINGLEGNVVQPGQTLKVIRGPFYATVSLKQLWLTLWLQDGRYACRFPIGVGRELPTNMCDVAVNAILPNPEYRGAAGTIAGGDPTNPYGKHWIELNNRLGIHGTNDPRNIGRNDVPAGCICIGPEDIEEVVDMLSVGSQVVIKP